eukprot:gene28042-31144_t
MQFLGSTDARVGPRSTVKKEEGEHSTRRNLVTLYTELPSEDITLDEFERLALDRLRVLKGIEEFKLRGKSDAEVQSRANELLTKHLEGATNKDTLRNDQLSHYILRLSYSKTPELRKWFVTQECELFKLRFSELLQTADDKAKFLERNNLEYTPVPDSEINKELLHSVTMVLKSMGEKAEVIQDQLASGIYKVPFQMVPDLVANRKVPFQMVPDLVANRKVFLKAGQAYVCQKDLASLGLSDINRKWRDIFPDSDQRLAPMVASLSQRQDKRHNYRNTSKDRHS